MAKYVEGFGYASSVQGSMAYDLGNPAMHPDYSINPSKVKTPVRPRTRARVRPRSNQIVSPGAVLGFAVAAMFLVLSLVAQIKLTEISNETVKLQTALSELKTQESKLKIEYEEAFNLTEIESFAVDELGMQKPYGDQVRYINATSPDNAVILQPEAPVEDSLIDRLETFLMSLGEYFE